MPLCAQTFDVQLNPSMYAGGYNISCHGSNNGAINTYIIGGTAPFTFVWSNGATTINLSNLTAGLYQVTVTSSNGISVNSEIVLIEPDAFYADVVAEDRGDGYHVSEFGGIDGAVVSSISGGVPPYTFLWSSGQSTENLVGVSAGTYTLTVHDATNCVTAATVTVVEPTLLHLVSISSPKVVGNYNISCTQFGTINVVVAGGRPPYEYNWDHGPQTQQVNDAEDAGLYTVHVTDYNRVEIVASITLSKSPALAASIAAFTYPNSKNTSCYNCNNGSIALSINSGTAPYTYTWVNGSNQQNQSNLAAGIYGVVINDAAGCSIEKTAILTAPEREDWTMNGNANTDSTKFIGTSDNKDFVFKTNNTERLKLMANGDIKLNASGLLTNGGGALYVDSNGVLYNNSKDFSPCASSTGIPSWNSYNSPRKLYTCPNVKVGIGTYSVPQNVIFAISGNTFFNGNIGIGNSNPLMPLSVIGDSHLDGNSTITGSLTLPLLAANQMVQIDANHKLTAVSQNSVNHWKQSTNSLGTGQDLNYMNGSIGIGTDPIDFTSQIKYKLLVNGSIAAKEVVIRANAPWPDFVFEPNYTLKPLAEIEQYIQLHNHLPGLPTALQIEKNGQSIGELQNLQQQKLEELYLYVIELKKEIETLKVLRK